MRFERLVWTPVPDATDDARRHAWTGFGGDRVDGAGIGKTFGAMICLADDWKRWTAAIYLRHHCKILPHKLNTETFPTAHAAKNWVRVTAETLGLLLERPLTPPPVV